MNTADALEASALPCAGAVHTDDCDPLTAELLPLPEALAKVPIDQKSAARWAYERLILYIQNFEQRLDRKHEVAVGFTGGQAGILRIEGLGYFDPDIVTFYGQDEEGVRTQLIQHVSQLNVILRAVALSKHHSEPRRIGFRLVEPTATQDTQPAKNPPTVSI